jgi:hypothetical protein
VTLLYVRVSLGAVVRWQMVKWFFPNDMSPWDEYNTLQVPYILLVITIQTTSSSQVMSEQIMTMSLVAFTFMQ